ncbi:MAG TPA: type II secretion system protein [Vicinamibacterales bacterium]|nr:type II secretion system protein [Vicinamibacterales bacterium]
MAKTLPAFPCPPGGPRPIVARAFTLVELLIVIAVVSILFSIAVPFVLSARMSSHEAAAINTLVAINNAQSAFKDACGHGRYAASLTGLGTPVPSTGEAFLSPDLTSGDDVIKSGYRFVLTSNAEAVPVPACNGTGAVDGYAVTADPVTPGSSGRRFFATNTSRVIYEHVETFAGTMPESGPPPAGTELRP